MGLALICRRDGVRRHDTVGSGVDRDQVEERIAGPTITMGKPCDPEETSARLRAILLLPERWADLHQNGRAVA